MWAASGCYIHEPFCAISTMLLCHQRPLWPNNPSAHYSYSS